MLRAAAACALAASLSCTPHSAPGPQLLPRAALHTPGVGPPAAPRWALERKLCSSCNARFLSELGMLHLEPDDGAPFSDFEVDSSGVTTRERVGLYDSARHNGGFLVSVVGPWPERSWATDKLDWRPGLVVHSDLRLLEWTGGQWRERLRAVAANEGRTSKGPAGYREVGCATVAFCDAKGDLLGAIRFARGGDRV